MSNNFGKIFYKLLFVCGIFIVLLSIAWTALVLSESQQSGKPLVAVRPWSLTKAQSNKNPYQHYNNAANLLIGDAEYITEEYSQHPASAEMPDGKPITPQMCQQALAALQPAVAEFMVGAACDSKDYLPPQQTYSILSPPFPGFARSRSLARIITTDAGEKIARGQTQTGIDELTGLVKMADELTGNYSLIGALVGVAIKHITFAKVDRILSSTQFTASDYRRFAQSLAELYQQQPSFYSVMEQEYLQGRNATAEMFQYNRASPATGSLKDRAKCIYMKAPGVDIVTVADFDRIWSDVLREYKKPYPEAVKFNNWRGVPIYDVVNGESHPKQLIPKAASRYVTATAKQLGLMLSCALEAYRLEHGAYPKSLTELVTGGYLRKLPTDPFTTDKPFIYNPTDGGYLLYSIGPDMKDDGGAPLNRRSQKGDIVFCALAGGAQ